MVYNNNVVLVIFYFKFYYSSSWQPIVSIVYLVFFCYISFCCSLTLSKRIYVYFWFLVVELQIPNKYWEIGLKNIFLTCLQIKFLVLRISLFTCFVLISSGNLTFIYIYIFNAFWIVMTIQFVLVEKWWHAYVSNYRLFVMIFKNMLGNLVSLCMNRLASTWQTI